MTDLDMRKMSDHYPAAPDQVFAWLMDRMGLKPESTPWIKPLLDEYQEASEMGMSLEEVVNGRDDTPRPTARKKKPAKRRTPQHPFDTGVIPY